MARLPDLRRFAAEHELQILTVADLIRYRLETEKLVRRRDDFTVRLDLTGTQWRAVSYETSVDAGPFLALVKGDPAAAPAAACRVHSGSVIDDVFGTEALGGRSHLRHAIEHIERLGHGVIVYLPPKASFDEELKALSRRHALRAEPASGDDVSLAGPPLREFGLGAQILRDLGLHRIRLLTNHPRKIAGIDAYGLEVVECLPLGPGGGEPG
jgi:3,4-dihydroxy 2-butanone 4-phosphate synthase/GTP cyclohydrolase II